MGFPHRVTDPNAITEVANDALSSDYRTRIRAKTAQAVELALDIVIKAMEGRSGIKPVQLQAARLMMPQTPSVNHGSAPLTLVLPGIPRPTMQITATVIDVDPKADPLG